ncbi:MAG TPA: hypothetical protein VG943_12395 [Caulobacterales bacterium]|nr:hypothetical protein [Caulobacterales bacterium]
MRNDVLIDNAAGCISDGELRSESTGFLLWRVVYEGDKVGSATAIFYNRTTKRLLFLNWAT